MKIVKVVFDLLRPVIFCRTAPLSVKEPVQHLIMASSQNMVKIVQAPLLNDDIKGNTAAL